MQVMEAMDESLQQQVLEAREKTRLRGGDRTSEVWPDGGQGRLRLRRRAKWARRLFLEPVDKRRGPYKSESGHFLPAH